VLRQPAVLSLEIVLARCVGGLQAFHSTLPIPGRSRQAIMHATHPILQSAECPRGDSR
jgi:hypothetical protein